MLSSAPEERKSHNWKIIHCLFLRGEGTNSLTGKSSIVCFLEGREQTAWSRPGGRYVSTVEAIASVLDQELPVLPGIAKSPIRLPPPKMSLPAQHIHADTEAPAIVDIIGVELGRAILLSYGHKQPDDSIVYLNITNATPVRRSGHSDTASCDLCGQRTLNASCVGCKMRFCIACVAHGYQIGIDCMCNTEYAPG